MKNYLLIYHAPAAVLGKMASATPEEKMKGMEPWLAWKEDCGDKIVDFGAPLAAGQAINPDGQSSNSTREVSGYSIIKAADLNAAKGMLKGHPHLSWAAGCSIEVHEAINM